MMYNISELLKGGWIPAPIQSGGTDIVGADILKQVFRRFNDRVYVYSSDDVSSAVNDITDVWQMFVDMHNKDISRISQAMTTDYKPLDNYNMTESGNDTTELSRNRNGTLSTDNTDTLTRAGTVTTATEATGKNVDTTTAEVKNTGTQTAADTTDTTNSIAAYNDTDVSIHDKQNTATNGTRTDNLTQTTTNGGEVNTTATTSATVTNDTTDTNKTTKTEQSTEQESGTDTVTHSLTRSGNIGVTTSQQMLSSEIFLRVRNQIAYYAVELFISQFTIW